MIDIGGPSMLRAAAKNFAHVVPVCNPERYGVDPGRAARVGRRSRSTRAATLATGGVLGHRRLRGRDRALVLRPGRLSGAPDPELREGDRPRLRREPASAGRVLRRGRRAPAPALPGRSSCTGASSRSSTSTTSSRARMLLREFDAPGLRDRQARRTRAASRSPARSKRPTTGRSPPIRSPPSGWSGRAEPSGRRRSSAGSSPEQFVDVLLAPDYDEAALEALRQKPNTRILVDRERRRFDPGERDYKRVLGGLLVQDRDWDVEDREGMEVVTGAPSEDRLGRPALRLARLQARDSSNAIVLAKDLQTLGIGAGQMSRVDCGQDRGREGARARPRPRRAPRSPQTRSSRSRTARGSRSRPA